MNDITVIKPVKTAEDTLKPGFWVLGIFSLVAMAATVSILVFKIMNYIDEASTTAVSVTVDSSPDHSTDTTLRLSGYRLDVKYDSEDDKKITLRLTTSSNATEDLVVYPASSFTFLHDFVESETYTVEFVDPGSIPFGARLSNATGTFSVNSICNIIIDTPWCKGTFAPDFIPSSVEYVGSVNANGLEHEIKISFGTLSPSQFRYWVDHSWNPIQDESPEFFAQGTRRHETLQTITNVDPSDATASTHLTITLPKPNRYYHICYDDGVKPRVLANISTRINDPLPGGTLQEFGISSNHPCPAISTQGAIYGDGTNKVVDFYSVHDVDTPLFNSGPLLLTDGVWTWSIDDVQIKYKQDFGGVFFVVRDTTTGNESLASTTVSYTLNWLSAMS